MQEAKLDKARHDVATAESLVVSQRQILAALQDIGADTSDATRLLKDFEGTLASRINRLARLATEAESKAT